MCVCVCVSMKVTLWNNIIPLYLLNGMFVVCPSGGPQIELNYCNPEGYISRHSTKLFLYCSSFCDTLVFFYQV